MLLGVEDNKTLCPEWYDTDQFKDTGYEDFERYFVNLSSNSAKFEVVCFKRYFMLYRYMCIKNVDCAMMLDSDVLCYTNCSSREFISVTDKKAVVFSFPGKWTRQACGPQFLFITREAVKSFIDFCMDMYKNRIDVLQKKYHDEFIVPGKKGGICDMQLLSMWCQTLDRDCLLNWVDQDTYLIDHCVNMTTHRVEKQFRRDILLRIKAIRYIDGLPHFYDRTKKQWCQVGAIHFQGAAKRFMLDFFYGRPYIVKLMRNVPWMIRRIINRLKRLFS